jgi:hypothetical protein
LPYTDIRFEKARKARDVKRRELQSDLKKRKESCSALTEVEYKKIINCWDEDTSSGLQQFFFLYRIIRTILIGVEVRLPTVFFTTLKKKRIILVDLRDAWNTILYSVKRSREAQND